MNYLLVGDTHFTDSPLDEYRWAIFKHVKELAIKHEVTKIILLGDLVDRKDRHSSVLVNRLIEELADLHHETGAPVDILSGNHDKPLSGPYYWTFLDKLDGVKYIRNIEIRDGIFSMPFSSNPAEEWKMVPFKHARAILMHQTITGAIVENDRVLEAPHPMPELPSNVPIFGGDIHRPQKVGNVVYVGCPHPVKFSESWPNRVVLIKDDDWAVPVDIWLTSIRRAIIDISNSKELSKDYYFSEGDQIRVRYHLSGDNLTSWPSEQEQIKKWALENQVYLASVEAVLIGEGVKAENKNIQAVELMQPEEVIKLFSSTEKLSDDLLEMGLELLKQSK